MRFVSAALLGLAVWVAASALLPAPVDAGVPCVVTIRDLPVGATLTAGDLAVQHRPTEQRPERTVASLGDAVGRVLSGPVTAGEIITTVRFQGPDQLTGLKPGSLAVGLPLTDPVLAGALRPGDAVSVLGAGTGQVVVSSAVVLAVRAEDRGSLVGSGGAARVLVAVTPDEARGLASALGPTGTAASILVVLRR